MTQCLGPIELDSNGEASGEGWSVHRTFLGAYVLMIEDAQGGYGVAGGSVSKLERKIVDYASKHETLRNWCRAVGWPGFEVTCGPLKLERDADWLHWEDGGYFVEVIGVTASRAKLVNDKGEPGHRRLLAIGYDADPLPSPQAAADALHAAILASADPEVVRFREEWMPEVPRYQTHVIPDGYYAWPGDDAPITLEPPRERIHYTLDETIPPPDWDRALLKPTPYGLETKARGIIEAAGIPYRGRVHARLHAVLAADGWMPLEAERLIQRDVREALRVVDWVTTGKTERDSR